MILKLADLVRVERRGQFQVYSLNTTVFQDLLTELLEWFGGTDDTTTNHAEEKSEMPEDRLRRDGIAAYEY